MPAYYNEVEPYAAQWLRNLIAAGHIARGDVDERSIVDVRADDLRGYTQCHFFAGIGVWSHAMRSAGWADERPVWTGSCPCQPFSAAGKRNGYADERHLWPHWYRLIGECRPSAIFGEQVAAAIRSGWLDDVCLSLESIGYAVGAVDFPACGVGAPHIRQRVYFVADAASPRAERNIRSEGGARRTRGAEPAGGGAVGLMADGENADRRRELDARGTGRWRSGFAGSGACSGFWSDAEWIACRDGKARPVEPGSPPLVAGATSRVGRLRAYGNAICAPQAQAFITAYMECSP